MKYNSFAPRKSSPKAIINPEQLWAIENELMDIPMQYRDSFWNELLASYTQDFVYSE